MSGEASNRESPEHDQLCTLLGEQRAALLQDDFELVQQRSLEITELVARLKAANNLPHGECLEQLRAMNEQLQQLLTAKKEALAAELANTRRKRELRKSYGPLTE